MKDEGESKMGFLTRKILRILGMNKGFTRLSNTHEEENSGANILANYSDWAVTRTALLRAERNKAEALMDRQRHFFAR